MNPDRLVYSTFLYFPLFNYLTNTGEITRYLLNQDIQLKECYETVYRLVEAVRHHDFERFKCELNRAKINTIWTQTCLTNVQQCSAPKSWTKI